MNLIKLIKIASLLACLTAFPELYCMEVPRVSDATEALFAALKSDNVYLVQQALQNGASLAANGERETPLHYAAQKCSAEIVLELLKMGAKVDATDKFGQIPLHQGAGRGLDAIVQILLESGSLVNARDESGATSLSVAAACGHVGVMVLLLNRGAHVNAEGPNGATCLHMAAMMGQEKVARLLLENGAEVNAADVQGNLPLHRALMRGHEAVVRLLLERGAVVTALDVNMVLERHTALMRPPEEYRLLGLLFLYGVDIANFHEKMYQARIIVHPLAHLAVDGCLGGGELAKYRRENVEHVKILTEVLPCAVLHCPNAIDYLIAKGAQVEPALRVLTGMLLRSNALNNKYSMLFVRLANSMEHSPKKHFLKGLLDQLANCPNKTVTRFIASLLEPYHMTMMSEMGLKGRKN